MDRQQVERLDYSTPPLGYHVGSNPDHDAGGTWYWQRGPEDGEGHRGDVASDEPAALAAAWAHYKERHDPPGMWSFVDERTGWGSHGVTGAQTSVTQKFGTRTAARAAAWAWYDRRLALAERLDRCVAAGVDACRLALANRRDIQPADETSVRLGLEGAAPAHLNMFHAWPRILAWPDDQVAAVERWLVDSTAELPGVLRA